MSKVAGYHINSNEDKEQVMNYYTKEIGGHTVPVPEGMRLYVEHVHGGNSTDYDRYNSKYMTNVYILKELEEYDYFDYFNVYNIDDRMYHIVACTHARCCKKDTPNRKRGLAIALERMRKVVDEYRDSEQTLRSGNHARG